MTYVNVRTGVMASLVGTDDKHKTVQLQFDDGSIKEYSTSTLKRWWKQAVDQFDVPEEQDTTDTTEETVQEQVEPEKQATPKKKGKKAKVSKAVINPNAQDIKAYIYEVVQGLGGELSYPEKAPNVTLFKVDGHMFARLNASRKQMTLCLRSVAVTDIAAPTKDINHMFNAGYIFTEALNKDSKKLIKNLLTASYKYQVNKKAGKEDK